MQLTHANKTWYAESSVEGICTAYRLQQAERLHTETTPFQTIEVFATEQFGKLMVFDDIIMLTSADHFFYHEMISHPALLCHPDPKDVAIIGGGDCGSLTEVLKHAEIKSVTQIEIDERVTRVAEEFFPELCASNQDARAKFIFDDGIAWMHKAPTASLDLIMIDSTDPIGPAVGLFQAPFYQECLRVLRPDGLLMQQSESPWLHLPLIRAMHEDLRDQGFAQVDLVNFPQPSYPSGWWSMTMASRMAHARVPRLPTNLKTRYYNPEVFKASLAQANFVKVQLSK